MRLSDEQISAIVSTIREHTNPHHVNIYLYGSRVNPNLKGGDIDLLIVADEVAKSSIDQKIFKLLNEIKKSASIGDRRIDLKIATESELKSDPFLINIAKTMKKI
ncbi:MAG: nucleotidyltransferase domain-containing protein [Oligoflexales bacterium]|nr:nucleotidyltransferase domain-containing protein [Oligoflexales bacterium]